MTTELVHSENDVYNAIKEHLIAKHGMAVSDIRRHTHVSSLYATKDNDPRTTTKVMVGSSSTFLVNIKTNSFHQEDIQHGDPELFTKIDKFLAEGMPNPHTVFQDIMFYHLHNKGYWCWYAGAHRIGIYDKQGNSIAVIISDDHQNIRIEDYIDNFHEYTDITISQSDPEFFTKMDEFLTSLNQWLPEPAASNAS